MKSLYVEGRPNAHVYLYSGPSLQVLTPGRAPGMYPIYRIGRLFLKGGVEIETQALVTCLKYGISITFIDGRGDAEGVCVGLRQRSGMLHSLLEELLEFENWEEHFDVWRSASIRTAILEAERELKTVVQDMRPRQAEDFLNNLLVLRHPGYDIRWMLHALRGLCYGITADRISKSNIDPRILLRKRAGFRLLGDLAELLDWKLFQLIDNHLSQVKKRNDLSMAEMAQWFEAKREVYENFIDIALTDLENWLHDRLEL